MSDETVRCVEYSISFAGKRLETIWCNVWDDPKSIKAALIEAGYNRGIKVRKIRNGAWKDVPAEEMESIR